MEKEKKRRGTKKWVWALMGCILIVVAVVLILLYLMSGQVSTTEGGGSTETIESLACEGDKVEYPFFEDIGDKQSMKINATFSNDKLFSISFVYQILYNDKEMGHDKIEKVRTHNQIAVTKGFQDSGVSVDALGVRFTTLEDGVQMSLYAHSRELSSTTSKYFLLESANGSYGIKNVKKIYEEKGLKCIIQNDNK